MNVARLAIPTLWVALGAGCAAPPHQPRITPPMTPTARTGQQIVICGQFIPVGVPVVLWTDPDGYDAYSPHPRFPRPNASPNDPPLPPRFGTRTRPGSTPSTDLHGTPDPTATPEPWTPALLAQVVDQFVVHYDVSGTSRQCFGTLHDVRGLSVHFLLDLDGTIYQTLDLQERAWHATIANDRSIGIEIAQIGAYPPAQAATLDRWYARDPSDIAGWTITLPPELGDGGLRTQGFIAHPARTGPTGGPLQGRINGELLIQHDFTPQQYESLARLLAALHRHLPRIALDAPRGPDARVLDRTLTPQEFADFHGLLGHYHVQSNKADPGPAFDWDRVLNSARVLARQPAQPPAPPPADSR